MADLFNRDFQDFLEALNKAGVEYMLVGGYAVILHGYVRSTADMDVWVNKTKENYQRLEKAFQIFGAPVFSEEEFLGNKFDVWGIGKEPNRIEILNQLKGVNFSEAFPHCETVVQNEVEIKYIHYTHLLKAKEAAGRFKDKDDIEQLKKRNG
jgi:hypothetical protein